MSSVFADVISSKDCAFGKGAARSPLLQVERLSQLGAAVQEQIQVARKLIQVRRMLI
jgi:hypothetical protein